MPEAEPVSIVCNLAALPDRARYRALLGRLRAAITGSTEQPNGYSYSVDGDQLTLPELGEWVTLERLCCPFLNSEFAVADANNRYRLTLTGPPGTKAILEREFSG